jgi:transposase
MNNLTRDRPQSQSVAKQKSNHHDQGNDPMAKFKEYDYAQGVLLPVNLEEQLTPGTLEFTIHALVESRIDMSVFENRYKNDETGRRAYDPKILLKVVLLAYARGIVSSRKIEDVCRKNVVFMALSCCQYPDHSTIAEFISSMKNEILPLFRDILLICEEEDLLGGTFFALDGCKLPSNASKQWSGTVADLKKKREKIEERVAQLLEQQQETDKGEEKQGPEGGATDSKDRKERIEKLKKKAERIQKWLEENDAKIGDSGKEIKSNITDNESAMMTTWHGTIQGYNGQALVDAKHQIIVHGEAFGKGQDTRHLGPMIDGAKENMVEIGQDQDYFRGKVFTADADYHSQTNLAKSVEEDLDAYIPDKRFRTRDPRLSPSRPRLKFGLEDFQYDQGADNYRCPEGKMLKLKAKKILSTGNFYRVYAADRKDCDSCQLRHRCLATGKGRRKHLSVPIGTEGTNLSKQMAAKIDSQVGRKIYPQRIAVVEPVFANIRTQKRMDRFTLRGKTKVSIQWLLYCMVHNIEKIMNYGFA